MIYLANSHQSRPTVSASESDYLISELSSPSSACYLSQNESVVCPHRAVTLQKKNRIADNPSLLPYFKAQ